MPHTESDSGNEQVYGPEIPPRLVPNFFNRHMNIPGNSIYVPVEYGSYGAAFSDVSMYVIPLLNFYLHLKALNWIFD